MDFNVTGYVDRESEITLTLTDSATATLLMAQYNKVDVAGDHLEELLKKASDYILIDGEIMQLGKLEHVAGPTYKARNFIRGCFGTKIAAHPAGRTVYFIPSFAAQPININQVPSGQKIWWRGYPVTTSKVEILGSDIYLTNEIAGNNKVGLSTLPLAPVSRTAVNNAGTIDYTIRPRMTSAGAGIGSLALSLNTRVSEIDHTYQIKVYNGTVLMDVVEADVTYDASTGICSGSYTPPVGATHIRIHATKNGKSSLDYVEISI